VVRETDLARLQAWAAKAAEARLGPLARWRDVRIGAGEEFARADCLLPEIVLEVEVAAPGRGAIGRVKICGAAGQFAPRFDASIRFLLRSKFSSKDFLPLFLSAIALSAAGADTARGFKAIMIGGNGENSTCAIRTLTMPRRDQAIGYLRDLVSDLFSGNNRWFLPVDAIEAARATLRTGGDRAALYEAIDSTRESSVSKYGPLRDANGFPAPPESEIRAIIDRRFGLLSELFGD
jgi:hypothetical protein